MFVAAGKNTESARSGNTGKWLRVRSKSWKISINFLVSRSFTRTARHLREHEACEAVAKKRNRKKIRLNNLCVLAGSGVPSGKKSICVKFSNPFNSSVSRAAANWGGAPCRLASVRNKPGGFESPPPFRARTDLKNLSSPSCTTTVVQPDGSPFSSLPARRLAKKNHSAKSEIIKLLKVRIKVYVI